MKNNNQNRNIILSFVVLLFFFATPVIAAPARVAILPFEVHAQNDLSFLQQGILDMLASRLAWPDKVEVINKNQTQTALSSVSGFDGESRALLVGGKLQANYVLFGSLTVFGESVSIDAKMVDISGQKPPLPFYAQTSGMGEVIPQINQFATTINATVFGRAVAPTPGAAGSQAGMPAQQAGPQAYNPRMHPEKLLQNGSIQSEGQYPVMGQPYAQTPNPAFIATAPAYGSGSADSFWRSQRFKSVITGLDIGDIDKDGQLETVIVTVNEVLIYRNRDRRLAKVAELEKINTYQYMGVDVGDINGNGYPEIFVSAVSPRKDAFISFVLEYDGSEYKRIATGLPWHFRIVKGGAEGDFLIGQKEPPTDGNLLSQPIFRMSWDGKTYAPGTVFLPGGKANILGVTAGNLIAENQTSVVGYSDFDRLIIFRPDGDVEWKSTDAHGGSLNYYQFPAKEDPNRSKDTSFFAMRLRTADLNDDGKSELIVATNNEMSNRLMKNQRLYNNSRLGSFSWNGMGMTENWKTNEISGRITDFFVGDFDNDGAAELVAAVVRKEGRIALTDAESVIIAYELKTE